MARIVAVHGTATTARVWDPFVAALPEHEVVAVERPRTGTLEAELEWLAPQVSGAWLVGMSGGATLGLALASRPHHALGMVLHEPAVGSLVPGLLSPVVDAFARGGAVALGTTLYGGQWTADMLGDQSDQTVASELAMFRAFEPAPPLGSAPVVVTVGAGSPAPRHDAAAALAKLGYDVRTLTGAHHFVGHDNADVLARLVAELVSDTQKAPPPIGWRGLLRE